MAKIVLSTLNARYLHTAFGLRYLKANLGSLEPECEILEFDISQRPLDICERVLALSPQIVGFGVYIWNATQTLQVVKLLKVLAPKLPIVLGGPEVSYETESQEICQLANFIVCGEADHSFRDLCQSLLNGELPAAKIIRAPIPDVTTLQYPYSLYSDKDIATRLVYVEASRGCPFTCEFCLSSLDIPVRQFDVESFLGEMQKLYKRGVRHFKFVDRTFNLNLRISSKILQFFLDLYEPGLFVHFEMVPDRLPNALRELIKKFPPGVLQFEVGIQSFNSEVGALISRRQDFDKLEENLRFLRAETGVHVHADLIAGLPGETLESFAAGFDRLVQLGPQEIQVGILKRLRGTPIARHTEKFLMKYNPEPPYELLENSVLGFEKMQQLSRFARYWDLIGNSGNFLQTRQLLLSQPQGPFWAFWGFSSWLFESTGARHAFALKALAELLHRYLIGQLGLPAQQVEECLISDYRRLERTDIPACLEPYSKLLAPTKRAASGLPPRQRRHQELPSV